MLSKTNERSAVQAVRTQEINPAPRKRRHIVPVKVIDAPAAVTTRSRRAPFKKVDVTRAISAVTKGGLVPASVEIAPDGNIRIYLAGSEPDETLFDKWSARL